MSTICIPVPMPEAGESIEMEVTVGGTKHLMQYRVEQLQWQPGTTHDERIDQLRDFIRNYEAGWELVQIGAPGPKSVPITFRQRSAEAVAAEEEPAPEPVA
jgi:hypothetical protein